MKLVPPIAGHVLEARAAPVQHLDEELLLRAERRVDPEEGPRVRHAGLNADLTVKGGFGKKDLISKDDTM